MGRRFLGLTLFFVGLIAIFSTLTFLALGRGVAATASALGGLGIAVLGLLTLSSRHDAS
jgi:hypothetical protein